jgi:hypothetical protein
MKITSINMAEVKDENPFYSVKWEDASPEKETEVFNVISEFAKSRV